MGALRLFLAISVVIGHTGPLFGLSLMPATEAVRIFFAISGFYMALVLSGRYAGRPMLFYTNRLARLWPMFLIAQVAIIGIALASPWTQHPQAPGYFLSDVAHGAWRSPDLAALLPNITMLGGDLLFLFHHGATGWHFTFGAIPPVGDPGAIRTGSFLINPPAWSIGTELWFYLLAPLLIPLRLRYLVALACASLGLQLWVEHLHPYTSYFLFPADLCFFLYGVIGFRFAATGLFHRLNGSLGPAIALGVLAVLAGREFIPFFRNYGWMHEGIAAVAIPFIFRQAERFRWDRWIGELSYPVYILHAGMITLAAELFGKASPGTVLLIVVPLAIAGSLLIEAPLDRWRAARARRAHQERAAGAPSLSPLTAAAE